MNFTIWQGCKCKTKNVYLTIMHNLICMKISFYLIEFLGNKKIFIKILEQLYSQNWDKTWKRRSDWKNFEAIFDEEFSTFCHNFLNKNIIPPFLYKTNDGEKIINGRVYSNRNVIQLDMPHRPSGIGYTEFKDGEAINIGLIPEDGGSLLFSQFHTGEVGVLLYPSCIRYDNSPKQYRLIKLYKSPKYISRMAIRYYLYLCEYYTFETSFFGHMSLSTRFLQFFIAHTTDVIFVFVGAILGFFASKLA